MNTKQISLDELPLYQTGIIDELHCFGIIRRRLLDLGLVEGTHITPVLISCSGDPKAFEVRGSLIAIRKEDTILIDVRI